MSSSRSSQINFHRGSRVTISARVCNQMTSVRSCCPASAMRTPFSVLPAIIVLFLASLPARAFIDVTLQMQLGNPSGATTNAANHDHFLIQRTVEAIDYSDNLREPNWASWDL